MSLGVLLLSTGYPAFADLITPVPASIQVTSGQHFSIDAVVSNIQDLYAFQFDWSFDPTVVQSVSVSEGAFLRSTGPTVFINGLIDNNVGKISGTAGTLIGATAGATGSGVLASGVFVAVSDGVAVVNLSNLILLNSNLDPISQTSSAPEPATLFVCLVAIAFFVFRFFQTGGSTRTHVSRIIKNFANITLPGPLSIVISFLAFTCIVSAQSPTPSTPYKQCPAIGLDTSCRILILIDQNGSLRVLTDTNVSDTYDGSDDTLIGVLNLSSKPVSAIPLHGADTIFAFDGDGICDSSINPNPPGCPFTDPNGYGGPGVTFSSISDDQTSGVVNFNPAIPPNGGTAYFGLELAIQTQCAAITAPTRLTQDDPRWGSQHLGTSKLTIAEYGCALTDFAMGINYFAEKQGLSFRTDPGKLNSYLTAKNGIDKSGNIPLSKVPLITKYARNNGVTMYTGPLIDHRDDFTLDQYLCHGYPPMLLVGTPHWVLATGQATSNGVLTYSDIDPDSWPGGDTLNNPNWNNTYRAMFLLSDLVGPLQGLYVVGHSPIEIVMTAPDGSQTGYNPLTDTRSNSISSSAYIDNQLASDATHGAPLTDLLKELTVPGAADGKYTIQIFGTGNGPYDIDVTYYDNIGNDPQTKTISGITAPGVVSNISVQYSSAPGAGATLTATCAADINGDGTVDGADLSLIQAAFGATLGSSRYNAAADLNHDGTINILDLAYASKQIGCTTTVK